jgi:tetratricopeptide (TPR) repeat protein
MNTLSNSTVGRLSLRLTPFIALVGVCFFHCTPAEAGDNCYFQRALQWDNQGNYDQAIANYNQAICICPDDAVAYNNRGYDWYMKNDFDKAIADYNQALVLCPKYAEVYSNRGAAWDAKGEPDRALGDYNEAVAVDPTITSAYNDRGVNEAKRGQYDLAQADFYRSMSADPNYAAAYENLGFQQATCPDPKYRDGKKAFANTSQGYQLDYRVDDYSADNALAAAYAESGDFKRAQEWQQKTVDLAPPKDKTFQTARLELYKQSKPYRSKEIAATST